MYFNCIILYCILKFERFLLNVQFSKHDDRKSYYISLESYFFISMLNEMIKIIWSLMTSTIALTIQSLIREHFHYFFLHLIVNNFHSLLKCDGRSDYLVIFWIRLFLAIYKLIWSLNLTYRFHFKLGILLILQLFRK